MNESYKLEISSPRRLTIRSHDIGALRQAAASLVATGWAVALYWRDGTPLPLVVQDTL